MTTATEPFNKIYKLNSFCVCWGLAANFKIRGSYLIVPFN